MLIEVYYNRDMKQHAPWILVVLVQSPITYLFEFELEKSHPFLLSNHAWFECGMLLLQCKNVDWCITIDGSLIWTLKSPIHGYCEDIFTISINIINNNIKILKWLVLINSKYYLILLNINIDIHFLYKIRIF